MSIEIINYYKYKNRFSFKKYAHDVSVNMYHNGFHTIYESETEINEKSLEIVKDILELKKIKEGIIVYRRCITTSWRLPYIQIFYAEKK